MDELNGTPVTEAEALEILATMKRSYRHARDLLDQNRHTYTERWWETAEELRVLSPDEWRAKVLAAGSKVVYAQFS